MSDQAIDVERELELGGRRAVVFSTTWMLLVALAASGCAFNTGRYVLAPGARGSIPPDWEACSDARSSDPDVVAVRNGSFEALAPGKSTIRCEQRKVKMEVRAIARIAIEGPKAPVSFHTYLKVRALDREGRELQLFDAVGITWTIPTGARKYDFCGHGNTFCDADKVQGVDAEPGTYRVGASYRGHDAWIDVTFVK